MDELGMMCEMAEKKMKEGMKKKDMPMEKKGGMEEKEMPMKKKKMTGM